MSCSTAAETARLSQDGGHIGLAVDAGGSYAGQMAAAPDATATGRLDRQRRTVGASNATALLTRSAAEIYDSLLEAGYEIRAPMRLCSQGAAYPRGDLGCGR